MIPLPTHLVGGGNEGLNLFEIRKGVLDSEILDVMVSDKLKTNKKHLCKLVKGKANLLLIDTQ